MKQTADTKTPVTRNCRYLDGHRRTIIPAPILEEAGIEKGTMLEYIACNGCIVARPVLGITVPDHQKANRLIRKGR